MRLAGRSEFDIELELTPDELREAVQVVLDAFVRKSTIIEAAASAVSGQDVEIRITTSSNSFAEVGREITRLANHLEESLRGSHPDARLQRGTTELVPA